MDHTVVKLHILVLYRLKDVAALVAATVGVPITSLGVAFNQLDLRPIS